MLGVAEGKEVLGESLGKGVTSKFAQFPSLEQQTLQHRHVTKAASPLFPRRQSEDNSSMTEIEEQKVFGTSPLRSFPSRARIVKAARLPNCTGIAPVRLF